MARPKLFYGWKIAGASFGLQFLQGVMLHHAFGAYVAIWRDSFGWSKTALSFAAVIQQVEGALLGPLQGWLIDKIGPRKLIFAGVFFFGIGLMILSRVQTQPAFYATFMLIALGASLCGYFSLTVTLVHWFEKHRARALSMTNLGFAVGGMAVPILAWSLVTFGWRHTAFYSGVLAILAGLPLAQVVRNRPADIGETVDGVPPVDKSADDANVEASRDPGFTTREAVRTSAFWLIALGHGFAMLVVGAVNVHAITHMKEGLGYTIGQAAMVIGVLTAAQVGGIVIGWWIGDRFEKRLICAVCMFAHAIALASFAFATVVPMVLFFAVVHGTAWGLRGSFMQAIRADFFGRHSIGMIMGLSSIIVVIGHVGGPLFAGIMADATGNYQLGYTILAIVSGLGALFFLVVRAPVRRARG